MTSSDHAATGTPDPTPVPPTLERLLAALNAAAPLGWFIDVDGYGFDCVWRDDPARPGYPIVILDRWSHPDVYDFLASFLPTRDGRIHQ